MIERKNSGKSCDCKIWDGVSLGYQTGFRLVLPIIGFEAPYGVAILRQIRNCQDEFDLHTSLSVGNGKKIRLWLDK